MARQFTAPAAFSDKPYTPIPMVPVTSNQVASIGYDTSTQTLAVSFTRGPGHIYHYPNVGPELYADFMASDSKGTFFGTHVKTLPFEKFAAPKPEDEAAEAA